MTTQTSPCLDCGQPKPAIQLVCDPCRDRRIARDGEPAWFPKLIGDAKRLRPDGNWTGKERTDDPKGTLVHRAADWLVLCAGAELPAHGVPGAGNWGAGGAGLPAPKGLASRGRALLLPDTCERERRRGVSEDLIGKIEEHMTNPRPSPTMAQMRLAAEVQIRQGDLEKALREALRASESSRESIAGEDLGAVLARAAVALIGMSGVGVAVNALGDASTRLSQEMKP